MNSFFFIGLPYAAISLFIIGYILRIRYYGYSVTSHSSQFLESKNLFWGSRFFHSGMVILFLGHLIGFLTPKSIIFVTSEPLWLIIIEVSAFAFGILTLAGFVILVLRRIRNKRLHSVTSTMDMVLYSVLFVQIITGLTIAYFYRWGTAWYVSVLVPYLRSLFTLTPDTAAISTMAAEIKIHIICGFLIIGLLPFTRLIHILSYPVYYLWRNYQLVIWNRNLKDSRASKKTREGAKPINN